jgi:hypothetical protein
MKRVLVPTRSGSDWQRLLAQPELHWKRGNSAMTAAASWESAAPRLPAEISAALDTSGDQRLHGLELLVAVPEWEVNLPGGVTSSHTDVLAVTRNQTGLVVVAVEAKVDEEFGPTIGQKRIDPSSGQKERLEFLHATLSLSMPLPDSIRYQLLHRAASAVLTARDFHAATAVMVIQSFSAESRWLSDYREFCQALGVGDAVGVAQQVPGVSAPALFVAWCTGDQRFRQVDLPSGI